VCGCIVAAQPKAGNVGERVIVHAVYRCCMLSVFQSMAWVVRVARVGTRLCCLGVMAEGPVHVCMLTEVKEVKRNNSTVFTLSRSDLRCNSCETGDTRPTGRGQLIADAIDPAAISG
jgi:hypothetical protein